MTPTPTFSFTVTPNPTANSTSQFTATAVMVNEPIQVHLLIVNNTFMFTILLLIGFAILAFIFKWVKRFLI